MHSGWQFWIDRGGTFTDIVGRAPGRLAPHPQAAVRESGAVSRCRDPGHPRPARPRPRRRAAGECDRGGQDGHDGRHQRAARAQGRRPRVLAITRGLGDALRIAYQNRPDIFARHIVLPEQLYGEVIEIEERCARDGTVERPLDLSAPAPTSSAPSAPAIRAIAIVLMHGYRYHAHELAVAELARAGRVHPGLGQPRGEPADEARRPRRHDRGRRLPVADPARLCRPGRRRDRRCAADVHAVQWRPGRRAPVPGQGRDPVRARPAASSVRPGPRRSPASTRSSASTWAAPRPT